MANKVPLIWSFLSVCDVSSSPITADLSIDVGQHRWFHYLYEVVWMKSHAHIQSQQSIVGLQ